MQTNDIILFGASGALLVLLLVNAAKVAGLPDGKAPLAALVAGIVVAALYEIHKLWPVVDPAIEALVLGLLLGAGGMGSYASTRAGQNRPAAKATATPAPVPLAPAITPEQADSSGG